jgi:hypothetical protein
MSRLGHMAAARQEGHSTSSHATLIPCQPAGAGAGRAPSAMCQLARPRRRRSSRSHTQPPWPGIGSRARRTTATAWWWARRSRAGAQGSRSSPASLAHGGGRQPTQQDREHVGAGRVLLAHDRSGARSRAVASGPASQGRARRGRGSTDGSVIAATPWGDQFLPQEAEVLGLVGGDQAPDGGPAGAASAALPEGVRAPRCRLRRSRCRGPRRRAGRWPARVVRTRRRDSRQDAEAPVVGSHQCCGPPNGHLVAVGRPTELGCLDHGAVRSVLVTKPQQVGGALLLMMLGTVVRASTRELATS